MRQSRLTAIIGLLVLVVASVPFSVVGQAGDDEITLPPWRRELPAGRDIAEIVVGETSLTVDLAVTGGEQSLGLGYRNGLDPGTGMLFTGTESRPKTFWMKGMRFCLDIVWIENDQIVGATEDVCPDPDGIPDVERARFSSPQPVTHVLEVPAGWLAEHGYGPGTPVDLSSVPGI
jgi:uncharacterized membrane protein (UPF0127 family)